ncbi:MAG TPA: hypothetical protein PKM97_03415 [Bacteroidia bacterium]|nr:hypothetical protein [Bacteroidia bacterium]
MAINKNHEFDDLEGVKCAIVEKNVSEERKLFLKKLLEFNGYTVIVVPSPATKAQPIAAAEGEESKVVEAQPKTYTVGVTDTVFNTTNAIYGRLLRTPSGRVVTMAYWKEKESEASDNIPYYERNI